MEIMAGRWCRPGAAPAEAAEAVGGEAAARQSGFTAARVPGSVHLEQFVPLLVEHFGADWWRRGVISVCFEAPVAYGEPVRSYLEPVAAGRVRIWMNGEGEELLLRGSATLGEDADSAVRHRLAQVKPAPELRILAGVATGRVCPPLPVRIASGQVAARLEHISEPMRCYHDAERYGAPVAPLADLVHAMRAVEPQIAAPAEAAAGAFGALEVGYRDGPALCDRDYLAEGRVLALSGGPKAEHLWYRTDLYGARDEQVVAWMITQYRLLKESSVAWQR
ncbi:MAG: hypothetical protein ACODAC_03515 [Pseudomonadota bacterium]